MDHPVSVWDRFSYSKTGASLLLRLLRSFAPIGEG